MHLDPQVLIAVATTLGAGWLMTASGVEKNLLERRRQPRRCPSCGRAISARVCATCSAV
jgi:recombinational DNA repair protein RecR